MTDHQFQEGDEVQHKTGSTKMIYIGEDSLGDALCEWADKNGNPHRATFSHAALKKYERPQASFGVIGRA